VGVVSNGWHSMQTLEDELSERPEPDRPAWCLRRQGIESSSLPWGNCTAGSLLLAVRTTTISLVAIQPSLAVTARVFQWLNQPIDLSVTPNNG